MTSSKRTTTPEAGRQRYVRRALQMNPMWQSAELVDWRAKALGRSRLDRHELEAKADGNISALRAAVRGQIARVQAEFWQLPLSDLKRRLDALDTSPLPDLAPVVNRLKTAAAARGTFPQLAQEKWMQMPLFNAFKKAVVLPPAEAAHVRERFLSRITDKKELKQMQTAIDRMQAQYPLLYALERDWFQTIKKFKVRSTGGESVSVSFSGLADIGWPGMLLTVIAIRVLFRILRMMGE